MPTKKFKIDLVDLPELETETINGKRYYVVSGEEKYPSVTTALDATSDKSHLERWKKRIGEKEANKISTQAKNRGTALHGLAEKYVMNEDVDLKNQQPSNVYNFMQIKKALDKHADNIRVVEGCLYSNVLKIAGRCDLICEWDNKLAVVDYKTSSKLKNKEWITDYLIQSSTYAYMFWERTGIMLKEIVILICVEDNIEPQVFRENPVNYLKLASDRYKQFHSM